jgi:hypothetical protein
MLLSGPLAFVDDERLKAKLLSHSIPLLDLLRFSAPRWTPWEKPKFLQFMASERP